MSGDEQAVLQDRRRRPRDQKLDDELFSIYELVLAEEKRRADELMKDEQRAQRRNRNREGNSLTKSVDVFHSI